MPRSARISIVDCALWALVAAEADQELIADFFAHVIFSGCRDFQCDSYCEGNVQVRVETAS